MTDKYTIECADRQDKVRHVYPIRKEVFVKEFGFPIHGMMYNDLDALSNHYLLLEAGKVQGCVSLVDLTGQTDLIEENLGEGIVGSVGKATKLAILPRARGSRERIRRLLQPVVGEIDNFDSVFADLGSPQVPNGFSGMQEYAREQERKAKRYCSIAGLEVLSSNVDPERGLQLQIGKLR